MSCKQKGCACFKFVLQCVADEEGGTQTPMQTNLYSTTLDMQDESTESGKGCIQLAYQWCSCLLCVFLGSTSKGTFSIVCPRGCSERKCSLQQHVMHDVHAYGYRQSDWQHFVTCTYLPGGVTWKAVLHCCQCSQLKGCVCRQQLEAHSCCRSADWNGDELTVAYGSGDDEDS